MSEQRPPDDHRGEEGFPRVNGEETVGQPTRQDTAARDRGLGTDVSDVEKKDSGFYGAGDNHGAGDDNLARETTPGYQHDKHDRGTIIPR